MLRQICRPTRDRIYMAIKDQTALKIVVHEGVGAQPLGSQERFSLVTALLEKGYSVKRAVNGEAEAIDSSNALTLGRFSESAQGRSHRIDQFDLDRICEAVEQATAEIGALKHGEWKPWFPVIDYDRCTNCMQCLSICLFVGYRVVEQH